MKKFWLLAFGVASLRFSQAQSLQVVMQNAAFLAVSTDTPYIETYFAVPGNELKYTKQKDKTFAGTLQVQILYERDTTIIAYDKYILQTPPVDDTSNITFTITDLRRVYVPDGDYTVKLKIADANNPGAYNEAEQSLKVSFKRNNLDFSDVELVDDYYKTALKNKYSKNGYDIKPHIVNYYSSGFDKMIFYEEIYNADKMVPAEDIIINYYIRKSDNDRVVNDMFRFTKQAAAPVNVLLSEIDISNLPSGNYVLEVQVKNKTNDMLGEHEMYFTRTSKSAITEWNNLSLIDISKSFAVALPDDSMVYYLQSLNPISVGYEREYIDRVVKRGDTVLMKQFFYNFWQKRSDDPQTSWQAYLQQVRIAEANFSTQVDHGFETDRGRVFLQYGAPNSMEKEDHEPGAYPYEIWHYYKLNTNQSNVKFVFCNTDLVTNNYQLIHSDAIGEVYDSRWKYRIRDTFKDNNGFSDLDSTEGSDSFGNKLDDNFNH